MACLIVLGTVGSKGIGYLTRSGPTPLRFLPLKKNIKSAAPLPVLEMSDKPPVDIDSSGFSNVPIPDVSNVTEPAPPPLPFPGFVIGPQQGIWVTAFDGSSTNLLVVPFLGPWSSPPVEHPAIAANHLLIGPHMLVEYFKPRDAADGGTNGAGVSVLLPVSFIPPTAAPSSQAIYRNP